MSKMSKIWFYIVLFYPIMMLVQAKSMLSAIPAPTNEHVEAPSTPITFSQESIDIALRTYNIKVPRHVIHPAFDLHLEDRGMTTLRAVGVPFEVTIGPMAFESWGLLAATLAHELEGHCEQNFTLIRVMDLIGLYGTYHAEKIAYQLELDYAIRFGLSSDEIESIQRTVDYYYPGDGNAFTMWVLQ